MTKKSDLLAESYLKRRWHELTEKEKSVIHSIETRTHITRNVNKLVEDERTFGERVADSVAHFGGSWTFIGLFATILSVWVIINTLVLLNRAFDPYPFILLNLFLSMLAALQAPIIMMSQNRQAIRDRIDAAHDYQVNLKAELEIRQMQENIDELRQSKWLELLEIQEKQIKLLEQLVKAKSGK